MTWRLRRAPLRHWRWVMRWPLPCSNEKDFVRLVPVIAGSELSALVAGTAELSIVLEPNTALGITQGFQVIQSFAEAFGPFFYTSFAPLVRAHTF